MTLPTPSIRSASACVLADFVPLQASPSIPQDNLLAYLAWLFATSHCVTAEEGSEEVVEAQVHDIIRDVRRYGVSPEHVAQRAFMTMPPRLAEVSPHDLDEALPTFFQELHTDPRGDSLDTRMRFFAEQVERVARMAWSTEEPVPDDIVHVTCSGYSAPNPIERFVSSKGWHSTSVTNSYHMGCYGAFPAVRIALGLLASSQWAATTPKERVDILHTELLSTHLDLTHQSPGDMVTMTLFGDGFIRYSAYDEQAFGASEHTHGLRVLALKECVIPDSTEEMTWDLQPHNFLMYLSPEVPLHLNHHILGFTEELLGQAGLRLDDVREDLICALHPGGPKIIEFLRRKLGFTHEQVARSLAVLREHGNMSSATVPHIWADILEDDDVPAGSLVLSMAFGPGLTATGMILQKVRR